jgi:cytochrome c556
MTKSNSARQLPTRGLTITLALLIFIPLALAHEGATGVVKERMDLMDSQKDAMKVIGLMAKGKTPFDAAKAAEAARHIETTSQKIHELFPEGSTGHPSDAKPEIWTQWDKFTGDADKLNAAAKTLADALEADSPDWKGDFKTVIDACKTCHKTFRAEKD